MSRQEFLRRLEVLLSDIPESERREALEYYRNYFEDADPGMEEQIIKELGSPEKVAASIKRDLIGEQGEAFGGQRQGEACGGQRQGEAFGGQRQSEAFEKQRRENRRLRNVLLVVALIFLSPLWIGLLGGAFGLLVGAVCLVFGFAICIIALVGALLLAGFVLAGSGVVKMLAGFPAVGLIVVAIGLFMLAFGLLGFLLMAWLVGRILPWTVRAAVRLCKMPFRKRGASI